MDEIKKGMPLWVKGVIGIAVVGGGIGAMAMGTKLMTFLIGRGSREEQAKKNIEELLNKSFQQAGIPIDLNTKTGGLAVKDEKGQTVFETKPTGDVPRDFPADIPVFQPSTVSGSMLMGPNKSLHLETAEPLEKVTEFYKGAMIERGWQEDQAPQAFGQQSFMTNWVKGQKQASIVATPPENGKTMIMINIHEQPSGEQLGALPIEGMKKEDTKDIQEAIKQLQQIMNQGGQMQGPPKAPSK